MSAVLQGKYTILGTADDVPMPWLGCARARVLLAGWSPHQACAAGGLDSVQPNIALSAEKQALKSSGWSLVGTITAGVHIVSYAGQCC